LETNISRKKEYKAAIKKYQKAVRYVDNTEHDTGDHLNKMKGLKAVCYSNASMCHLNLNQWADALAMADKCLAIEPTNVKTLFRKAKAMSGSKDYLPALTILKQAETLDPANKDIKLYSEKVKKLHETLKQKQSKAFANMFSRDDDEVKAAEVKEDVKPVEKEADKPAEEKKDQ